MQPNSKSLLSNYIFNLLKTFSSLAFPIITFTYSARILGVEGVGQVNFARSVVMYFTFFALLGMNYYGTREAAKLRGDRAALSKFVQEMLIFNGISTALAYVFLFISMVFIAKLRPYQTLLLVNSAAILLQGLGMEWLYQGLEEYRYIALRSVAFQFVALGLMFLLVRKPEDVVPYTAVTLLATSGPFVLNFINARKFVDFRLFDHYEIKAHLKPLCWLFALVVSMELYTVMDSTLLGFLKGDAAVGRYTAAVKVNKMVITMITAIGVVLIPRLAFYIGEKRRDKVDELVEKAYNYTFLLSVPAAVGLFVLSDEIILLVSGAAFSSAALTLRLLTPIVLVIPFSVATNQQTLIPMGYEKLMLKATSLGAVTDLVCNIGLIPPYGENGAAIATVLAETVVAVVSFYNAGKFFTMRQFFRNYHQYWMAAMPIFICAYLGRLLPLSYIARMTLVIVASVSCYFCVLQLLHNAYYLEAVNILRQKTVGLFAKTMCKGGNER